MTSTWSWTPAQILARVGPGGVTIYDALNKELGLKLALETAPRRADCRRRKRDAYAQCARSGHAHAAAAAAPVSTSQ